MFPSLPDNFNKILIAFAIVLLVYSFLEQNKYKNDFENVSYQYDELSDSLITYKLLLMQKKKT
jgi:hypothetical protein